MKILMPCSEMTPFARTGGLGDVLEALPLELERQGHQVSVVLPYYRAIREYPGLAIKETGVQITVQVGAKRLDAEILEFRTPGGIQVFLVRRDEYFDRSGFYGAEGRDYEDNAERFIYFSKAVIELARRLNPLPDILHVHDWQTALIPVFADAEALPMGTVLTIHNMAYQGSFWGVDFGLTNLPPEYFSARGVEFYGRLNFLKGGILCADAITTVSERYAREIQTPEFGAGLDAVMRENSARLSGILNGADYSVWDPRTDKLLPATYTPRTLKGKAACREALLSELGLDPKPRGPVFAMVTRLARQKGIDLLLPLLDRLLAADVRLVILGEGDAAYERDLGIAVKKHRRRFAFRKMFDNRLAHWIEAGGDISLFPSQFEPCGLSAMYSLRYGAVPIARASGGLHQIIQDYDPATGAGNGFLFFDYSPEAFWDSIRRASDAFADQKLWLILMRQAMDANFSWENAARAYEKIYRRILKERPVEAVVG